MNKTSLTLLSLAVLVVLVGGQSALAGTIWGCTQSDWRSDSHLYCYDTTTSAGTDYGTIQGLSLLTDLAVDNGGTLYGVGFRNSSGSGASKLYSIVPGGGGSTIFSELPVSGNLSGTVNGMAWYDGALYLSANDRKFYKLVEETSGTWTVAKQGRMSHASSGDLAFSADGTLYAVVRAGNNAKLATIDFDTGSRHFGKDKLVGGKTGYRDVYGIAFDDGVLYGAATTSNFADSDLVTLDLTTGRACKQGGLDVPVWGMASGGGSSRAVPEPATVALLSMGMLGLMIRRLRRRVSA